MRIFVFFFLGKGEVSLMSKNYILDKYDIIIAKIEMTILFN